jgi:transglutaminase-like putative cysteine protease
MKNPPAFPSVLALFVCILAFSLPIFAAFDDWKPVDPGEIALKAPIVEKDADAEALFWEVRIDDNPEGDLIFNHYIRIKVFTDRGRESQSKIDIPFGNLSGGEVKIKDIAARTIKADGSIVELKKDDIFERTIVKVSGLKVKARSFAMPAVEPGCIIEYRWREIRVKRDANYVRLMFQREIPVQRVDYYIKPYAYPNASFNSITLHGRSTPFVKDKAGFYKTTMTDVPALHEESRMPPEDQVKTWMLVYYASGDRPEPTKFWFDLGRRFYDSTKSLIKANDEVKQKATALVADAKSDDEKIQRLFDFCRTGIKNASNDASGLTAEERAKLKDNKTPSDTLKRGIGNSMDIDLLFAALANGAGFDARIVLSPDRGDIFFDKGLPNAYFLDPQNVAVSMGGTWKFFDPGLNYVPYGMLRWQEEGTQALITDPKQPVWVDVPMSAPDQSKVIRRAKFKLLEDGTIEGDVKLEYSGHFAIERKEEIDEESDTRREEIIKEEIKDQMSSAEVTDIKLENVTDHVKPLMVSYHVRFPGYAQKTGKRLFLQPAFFQKGISPIFASANRRYQVYFHYPWAEDDRVEFELPAGYALDNPDSPAPFGSGKITEYHPSLGISNDGKQLVFKRSFFFGGGETVLFPAESYPQLKIYFDELHKNDNHTVALKQNATN